MLLLTSLGSAACANQSHVQHDCQIPQLLYCAAGCYVAWPSAPHTVAGGGKGLGWFFVPRLAAGVHVRQGQAAAAV